MIKNKLKNFSDELKVIFTKTFLSNFISGVSEPYDSVYVNQFASSKIQIGFLSSLNSFLISIFSLPGGFLADRFDRKKVYLFGLFLSILVPFFYFIANDWNIIVIAIIFSGISTAISSPAWNAILANSTNNEERGYVYALVNIFTILPVIVAPIIASKIIGNSMKVEDIKPIYLVQLILIIVLFVYVTIYLKKDERFFGKKGNIIKDYFELQENKNLRYWLIIKSVGALIFGLSSPFMLIYAVTIGASAIDLAMMITLRKLSNMIFSLKASNVADEVGRKKTIILSHLIMYLAIILFISAKSPEILILSYFIWGISDAFSIAWSMEMMELVSPEFRSRWSALETFVWNLFSIPAFILGGFIWEKVNFVLSLMLLMVIDATFRMTMLYLKIPETKKQKWYVIPPLPRNYEYDRNITDMLKKAQANYVHRDA
ncbi:MAG: MFS transporter [Candidatus Parvarchaeota archaeon]|nr:MFS transporter [Candidatus Jingweiarchaeum tengchongense]MCW1298034.1 MFS transporter [Candidatus Jingweiarchaeum tengchongense]MCW1300166.1 MFS transporter [Candidatus Jingweiarchaeum tengchongense]MCW1304376.1 MFS transporter [Candidatus Jingweiarchaeum tengchongense]MCW1305904.1 MFS transporter [Candidatus Jingweiarchaeum tengchongense]